MFRNQSETDKLKFLNQFKSDPLRSVYKTKSAAELSAGALCFLFHDFLSVNDLYGMAGR